MANPAPREDTGRLSNALLGGLLAGVLDIIYAFVNSALAGRTPLRVLQSVASGLLGASAFKRGIPAAALGLFCHFVIAVGAALVYLLAARLLPILRDRPLLGGAVFGPLVYLFMSFVVLPLSAVPFKIRHDASVVAQGFLSHALLVGIPISLAVADRLRPRG